MFEWLEREIAEIRTPRFHLVDGPASHELREAISQTTLPLPASYKEFVLKFGNARLYRQPKYDAHKIRIFAGPAEASLDADVRGYKIGFNDGANVYLKPAIGQSRCSIIEFESELLDETNSDFEQWLAEHCAKVRQGYSREQWAEILRGPEAFNEREKLIIAARKKIRWRVAGIDADRKHIIEISNTSDRIMPVFTVGARSRDHRLNGAIRLKIGHIGPGQREILHADCYGTLVSPQEIEIFDLPDPLPEDRERFEELAGG